MRSLVIPVEAHIPESPSSSLNCQHRSVYLTCISQWFGVHSSALPPDVLDGARFRRFCKMPSIEDDDPEIVCEQREVTALKLFPSRPHSFGSIFILTDSDQNRYCRGLFQRRGPIETVSHRQEFRNVVGPMLVLSSYLSCIKDSLRRSVEDWSDILDVIDKRLALDVSHPYYTSVGPLFNQAAVAKRSQQ